MSEKPEQGRCPECGQPFESWEVVDTYSTHEHGSVHTYPAVYEYQPCGHLVSADRVHRSDG